MKRVILAGLLLVLPATAWSQQARGNVAADSFLGEWTADLSKSQRDENHQFTRLTIRFHVEGEALLLFQTGINRLGNEVSNTTTFYPDGKEYPVEEAPGVVAVAEWVGPRTLDTKGRKDGQLIGHGTYEVSVDGQMLTATVFGMDARGRPFEQVIVFDRD